MAPIPRYDKDPDDILDYPFNWTGWLAGDTIATSTWSVDRTGLTTSLPAIIGTSQTVVWLSGGALDQTYNVSNRITTNGGRTVERSICIRIRNQ